MLKSAMMFVALALPILCSSACHAQDQGKLPSKLSILEQNQNSEAISHLRGTFALIQIIDPKNSKKIIERAHDIEHFKSLVDDWVESNPKRWAKALKHQEYCDSLRNMGELGTDIDAANADVRWELFIRNGQPDNMLTLPCKCDQGAGACSLWTYTWQPESPESEALELSCQSRRGESYPTRIITGDRSSFPEAAPIWPLVNVSKFSDRNGAADVWFSIWIRGDQFTRPTLDSSRLVTLVELYDSSRSSLVARGTCRSDLQIIRGLLEASDRSDRKLIRAMGYVGFTGIEGGNYCARVKVAGAPYNEGEEWFGVSVPDDIQISDLLLLDRGAGSTEKMQSGIIRSARVDRYDNPEAVFASGSRLNLYVEAELPQREDDEVAVWVTLLPLPEVGRRYTGHVSAGEAVVVADSLGQPIEQGRWQSPHDQEILSSLAASDISNSAITLLRKRIEAGDSMVVVEVEPSLSANLKSGRYVLTLTISDPNYQRYFLAARRIIRVAKTAYAPTTLGIVRKY